MECYTGTLPMSERDIHVHVHIHGDPVMAGQLERIAVAMEQLADLAAEADSTGQQAKGLASRLDKSGKGLGEAVAANPLPTD